MLKQGVDTLLGGELEEELGIQDVIIEKKSQITVMAQQKTVRTDLGEIEMSVPRDRNGDFEAQILLKNSRDLSAIEDKVISMYVKGMSQRDISDHIEEI